MSSLRNNNNNNGLFLLSYTFMNEKMVKNVMNDHVELDASIVKW